MRALVHIEGDGVAARAAGTLLRAAGIRVTAGVTDRRRVPAVLVSQATQRLFADVFGTELPFAGQMQVKRRVVRWGDDVKEMPHEAVVVAERTLLEGLPELEGGEWEEGSARLLCRLPLPEGVESHVFGARVAWASEVVLEEVPGEVACYAEAVESGWLFLLPTGNLLRVGEDPELILKQSELIRPLVREAGAVSAGFACSPRVNWPLGGEGWLAAGSAAMGFDPLCGDGTGNALREAILAGAIYRAEHFEEGMLWHYQGRLVMGMMRHLQVCRDFYASGWEGSWWKEQLRVTEEGIAWCGERVRECGGARYRMVGWDLVGV